MCALRHSVRPEALAHQYRLNIPTKKAPVVIQRTKKEEEPENIFLEVKDEVNNSRFSSASFRMPNLSIDDELDADLEDEFYFACQSPVAPPQVEMAIKIYEAACKKHSVVPLTNIKSGLLKQTLSCKFVGLQNSDCKCICLALIDDRFVQEIDFQQNGMGPLSASYFAEVIDNSPFLTRIRISDNELNSQGAKVICDAVRENHKIQSLDLSGNGLVESDGEHFKKLIEESPSLKELYLGHNELMDFGVRKIAQGLHESSMLRVLDLSWNHIRLKGAEAIGEALEKNTSLEKVNLAWNGLHQDGAESIAHALKKNDTLCELDITCNRLSEYCIAEILRGLDSNSTLEILRIGQNHITTRGALTILQHVKENKTSGLNLLDFGNQEVHDTFVDMYRELQKERDITVIYGPVWSTDRTSLSHSAANADEIALMSCNPLTVLMECMRLQNLRLIDFFKSLDTNKSNLICINELCEGMLKVHIPLRRETLLKLLHRLDKDGNNHLDFAEMIEAQNIHRQNLRRVFAEQAHLDFERTEIGKVSVILRRLMGTNYVMKKTDRDTRLGVKQNDRGSSNRTTPNSSRSGTPTPFQFENVKSSMPGDNTSKDKKSITRTLSQSSSDSKISDRKSFGSRGSSASSDRNGVDSKGQTKAESNGTGSTLRIPSASSSVRSADSRVSSATSSVRSRGSRPSSASSTDSGSSSDGKRNRTFASNGHGSRPSSGASGIRNPSRAMPNKNDPSGKNGYNGLSVPMIRIEANDS